MKSKPAYLTLLLALLHGAAGITILVISSWFIAISAIAPVGFNYVIPAHPISKIRRGRSFEVLVDDFESCLFLI